MKGIDVSRSVPSPPVEQWHGSINLSGLEVYKPFKQLFAALVQVSKGLPQSQPGQKDLQLIDKALTELNECIAKVEDRPLRQQRLCEVVK